MSKTNSSLKIDDVMDDTVNNFIDDTDLDAMLEQWANAEVMLPEGFHETVMNRLRAEETIQTVQKSQQKTDKVVSLSQWLNGKKTWISAIAAAALVLCCLPVVQNYQENLTGVHNSAVQVYDLKSNGTEQEGAAEPQIMMTSLMDTEEVGTPAYNTNAAMEKSPVAATGSFDYSRAEMDSVITLEEQLVQANEQLALLNSQLETLSEDETAQRTALETEIDELHQQIKQLEQQIAEEQLLTADEH